MYYLEFIISSSKNVTAKKMAMAIKRLHFLVAYEFVSASPTVVCDSS